jgi:hypothetical protein
MTAFGGEDIEKRLWIKFKKTFLVKLVRQRITLGDRRISPFLILYYLEKFAGVRVLIGNGFQGVRLS